MPFFVSILLQVTLITFLDGHKSLVPPQFSFLSKVTSLEMSGGTRGIGGGG